MVVEVAGDQVTPSAEVETLKVLPVRFSCSQHGVEEAGAI
jgi:hypothetical protein